ncbi:hypothetical protein HK101_004836 [Irineochytrium annulatum]|nr:hypothetical protein HK101_004836 [Irineochytrium annulatum]
MSTATSAFHKAHEGATVLAYDYEWRVRNLALTVLGKSMLLTEREGFPTKIRKLAFDSILAHFNLVFNEQLRESMADNHHLFEASEYVLPQVFQPRVSVIYAIAECFRCPESKTAAFMHHIDSLFTYLLRPTVHPLLQAAVVHAINNHFQFDNRNRLRVEWFYRRPIAEIATTYKDAFKNTDPSEAPERSVAPHTPDLKKHGVTALRTEVFNFFRIWYPKLSDEKIVKLGEMEEVATKLPDGYGMRRLQWLSQREKPDSLPDSKAESSADKFNSLQKVGRRRPYETSGQVAVRADFFKTKPYRRHPQKGSL